MIRLLQTYDTNILELIRIYCHTSILDKLMPFITSLGNGGIVWAVIAVILMFNKKYRYVGFMVIGSLLLSFLLGDVILKHLIQRTRPFSHDLTFKLLVPEPTTYIHFLQAIRLHPLQQLESLLENLERTRFTFGY